MPRAKKRTPPSTTTTTSPPPAVGTGKVTPVQIAFIVDRYLADNSFTNTLTAFRSEAAALLSKTKGKEAPKGLMGLGDILDEYITLKERRVMLDQEKRRVDAALQGIQGVMQAYLSPIVPVLLPTNNSPTPPGHAVYGTALVDNTCPPMLPPKVAELNSNSTPVPNTLSSNKRKASKPAPKAPAVPKKSRTQPPKSSSNAKGKTSPSQATCISNTEQIIQNLSSAEPTSKDSQITESPPKGSSIVKSLFKQQPESQSNSSSPKTPPLALPSHADKSVSPPEDSSLCNTDVAISREIISSETIIVSPLKRTSFFSVERSYQVTSSPFKSSPNKQSRREHIKGRLQFDEPEASTVLEGSVATSSSSDEGSPGFFDYDMPDIDIFDGDFSFSELLGDIDFTCEDMVSTCQSVAPANLVSGSEHNADIGCSENNQDLPGSCLSTATRMISEDTNIQGPDSVTSMTTIRQCIQILSPAKIRSKISS